MEQFVILLLIGAVSLVQWLMKKSAEAREKAQREAKTSGADEMFRPGPLVAPREITPPATRDARTAEAARRLREALGLPPEPEEVLPEDPAPVVSPRSRPPVILEERVLGPEEIVTVEDLEPRTFRPPSLPTLASLPIPAPALPAFASPEPSEPARSALNDLLRSRAGLRQAILAQEILGTPKGLVF